jgi:aminoglycoside 6'-N-acetyltransferase I
MKMTVEEISEQNLESLVTLMLELWPDCHYDEEYQNCRRIHAAADETCFLLKENNTYIAFIQLALRHDYVESTESSPVAYIEGIYVRSGFRRSGLAAQLVQLAKKWTKEKGCSQLASDAESTNATSITFHKKTGFKEVNRLVCFVMDMETKKKK